MVDFPALLKLLERGGVKFIIIGGAAATAHGAARLTLDLDIVYERSPENIRRLVEALEPAEPYLRGAPPGLPFKFDTRTVETGLNFTLSTTHGALDTLGTVTGGGDYNDLAPHTMKLELFGVECLCLDLPTLIKVKRAAGRPKDLEAIAELEVLLETRIEEPGAP